MKDVTDKVREEYIDLAREAIAGKPYPPAQEVSLKTPLPKQLNRRILCF